MIKNSVKRGIKNSPVRFGMSGLINNQNATVATPTYSVAFNGSTGYLTAGNILQAETSGSNIFTLECYVYLNNLNSQAIVSKLDSANNKQSWHLFLDSTDGWLVVASRDGTSSNRVRAHYGMPNINTWYHVLVVFDPANATTSSKIKFFVNTVQLTGTVALTGTITTINSNTTPIMIGARNASSITSYLNGKVDNVRIFSGDQSASVSTLFNGGVPRYCPSSLSAVLLAEWLFENNLNDTSPGAHNLALSGGVTYATGATAYYYGSSSIMQNTSYIDTSGSFLKHSTNAEIRFTTSARYIEVLIYDNQYSQQGSIEVYKDSSGVATTHLTTLIASAQGFTSKTVDLGTGAKSVRITGSTVDYNSGTIIGTYIQGVTSSDSLTKQTVDQSLETVFVFGTSIECGRLATYYAKDGYMSLAQTSLIATHNFIHYSERGLGLRHILNTKNAICISNLNSTTKNTVCFFLTINDFLTNGTVADFTTNLTSFLDDLESKRVTAGTVNYNVKVFMAYPVASEGSGTNSLANFRLAQAQCCVGRDNVEFIDTSGWGLVPASYGDASVHPSNAQHLTILLPELVDTLT